VNIRFYPIEERPVVEGYNNNNPAQGDFVEFDFCAEDLTSTTDFDATTFFTDANAGDGTNSQRFNWYFSDPQGTRNPDLLIKTGSNITASEMLIAGITSNRTQYFLVTQTTDIEDDGQTVQFPGVESEGTLVRINIYNAVDPPVQQTSTSASDPGTLNFYYCDGDTIDPLQVKSQDEDKDVGNILFYWYRSEADALSQSPATRLATASTNGAVITPAELLNDNPNSTTDPNAPVTIPANMVNPGPGTYTFYVTQVTNFKPNASTPGSTNNNGSQDDQSYESPAFIGCESEPLELTIFVRDIPIAPAVVDQTLFICEGDATPNFSISGFDSKITYVWKDSVGVEQARGQNYTPVNFSGNGFFGYTAQQVTDINLNNEGFAGCESPATDLLLTVRDIPVAPPTTGTLDSANNVYIYEICEGDAIPTFFVANADTARQRINRIEYLWYDQDNDQLSPNSSEFFNPASFINTSNLTPEVANDFRFRVTQRTNIKEEEEFDGCISDFTDVVLRINGLPSLSFTNIQDNNAYCLELGTTDFSAAPLGIAGSGIFSLYKDFAGVGTGLVDNADGTARLNLQEMHLADDDSLTQVDAARRLVVGGLPTQRNIYFRYTDVKGCVNTDSVTNIVINSFPAINFRIDDTVVDTFQTCLNEATDVFLDRSFNLVGFQAETGAGIGKNGIRSDFRIFDEAGTELEVGIVSDLDAVAEFSPIDARKSLSLTDENIQDYAPANTYTITFTHTDANGCTNTVDNKITVQPLPQFGEFRAGIIIDNKACASETVDFNVDLANLDNSLATFNWALGNDPVEFGLDLDNNHLDSRITVLSDTFNIGGGPKEITVRATNNITGCQWEVSEIKSIGVVPTPRFKWDNITVNKETVFSFQERALDPRFSEYDTIRLVVTDQSGNVVTRLDRDRNQGDFGTVEGNGAMLNDFVTTFTAPGIYNAEFYLRSTAACDSTIIRDLNILDKIVVPAEGLLHTFDAGPEGWHTDSISVDGYYDGISDTRIDDEQASVSILRYSTWEWGTPSGRTLNLNNTNGTAAAGGAWATNTDGAYGSKGDDNSEAENSWVYSPTYDISALAKPSISFNYASQLINTDGVVLQYSVDEGRSWRALGEFDFDEGNSGINWYNFLGLPGNPGNIDEPTSIAYNPSQFGWTTSTDVLPDAELGTQGREDDYYWYFAAHKIDEKDTDGNFIIDPSLWSDIRFRFALGSRPSVKQDQLGRAIEGFVFDNIRIFDRNKVVLFESFSSALSADSKEAETIIQDRVAKAGEGTVWINYYTDLDGEILRPTDRLFNRNETDPHARGGFYGIDEAPTSVLDGEVIERQVEGDSRADELLGWNQFALNKKELVQPEFDIALQELNAEGTDQLRVGGTFTSLIDLPANTELSFRFIVLEDYITNQELGLFTITDTVRNVMRKILPDPSGFVEKGSVSIGDAFTFEVEWTIFGVFNLEELRVIAFVQNEETREIYQVNFIEIDGKANTVTGLEDDLYTGDEFEVYPNPANDIVTVSFDRGKNIEVDWTVFDQSGRIMKQGILNRKQREMKLDVSDVPSGVYFLQFNHIKYKWEPRRIIVIHN
jgi:hypothetical protein